MEESDPETPLPSEWESGRGRKRGPRAAAPTPTAASGTRALARHRLRPPGSAAFGNRLARLAVGSAPVACSLALGDREVCKKVGALNVGPRAG